MGADRRPLAATRVVALQRNRESGQYLGQFETATKEDGSFVLTDLAPNEDYWLYVPMKDGGNGLCQPQNVMTLDRQSSVPLGDIPLSMGRRVSLRILAPPGFVVPPHAEVLLGNFKLNDAWSKPLSSDGRVLFESAHRRTLEAYVKIEGVRVSDDVADEEGRVIIPEGGDVESVVPLECEE